MRPRTVIESGLGAVIHFCISFVSNVYTQNREEVVHRETHSSPVFLVLLPACINFFVILITTPKMIFLTICTSM